MIDLSDYYYTEALKLARRAAEEGEVPVGAVLVCGNKLLAKTWNQTERLHDVTAHAEILAITAAAEGLGAKYLRDCTLYVTLEPCPMCAAALHWAQLGRLIYGASDPRKGYSLYQPPLLHPKTEVTCLDDEESSELVKSFFKSRRERRG